MKQSKEIEEFREKFIWRMIARSAKSVTFNEIEQHVFQNFIPKSEVEEIASDFAIGIRTVNPIRINHHFKRVEDKLISLLKK